MSAAKFTTDEMRRHVRSPNRTIAWDDTCTTMIRWAADVIDAANELAANSEHIHAENKALKEQNALLTVQVKRHRELLQYIRDNILDGWSMDDLDNLLAEPIDLSAHPQQVKSEDARDAARYRFLRDKHSTADEGGLSMIAVDVSFQSLIDASECKKWPDCVDKSIDAAIPAQEPKG